MFWHAAGQVPHRSQSMPHRRRAARSRAEKEELYRALLAEQEACGLSLAEVSRQTGIPVTTLSWWRKRLGSSRGSTSSAPVRVGDDEGAISLLPVAVSANGGEPAPPPGVIEVSLPGGAAVRVPAVFEDDVLRRVVGILTESC